MSLLKTVEQNLTKTKSQELIIRLTTLVLIYLLAFSIRLVSGRDRIGAVPVSRALRVVRICLYI